MTTTPTENLAALAALCMPLHHRYIVPETLRFEMVNGEAGRETWALTAEMNGVGIPSKRHTVPFIPGEGCGTTDRGEALKGAWAVAEMTGRRARAIEASRAETATGQAAHSERDQRVRATYRAEKAVADAEARAKALVNARDLANWLGFQNRHDEAMAVHAIIEKSS